MAKEIVVLQATCQVHKQQRMINIGFDLISDHCGMTLHPRVSNVSALTMVLRHVGLLATQSTGPSVQGLEDVTRETWRNLQMLNPNLLPTEEQDPGDRPSLPPQPGIGNPFHR